MISPWRPNKKKNGFPKEPVLLFGGGCEVAAHRLHAGSARVFCVGFRRALRIHVNVDLLGEVIVVARCIPNGQHDRVVCLLGISVTRLRSRDSR